MFIIQDGQFYYAGGNAKFICTGKNSTITPSQVIEEVNKQERIISAIHVEDHLGLN